MLAKSRKYRAVAIHLVQQKKRVDGLAFFMLYKENHAIVLVVEKKLMPMSRKRTKRERRMIYVEAVYR